MWSHKEKGFTLTEVNLSVILATILMVPFIAFYGGTQRAFLMSYNQLNYLHKTTQIGKEFIELIRVTDSPAADTVSLSFPGGNPAVDHAITPDKHIQFTYTPTRNGVDQAPETLQYVYDEANEQIFSKRGAEKFKPLNEKGMIKAFIVQYFDSSDVDANYTPLTPVNNPTNVRRVKLTLVANAMMGFTITKGDAPGAGSSFKRSMLRQVYNNKPILKKDVAAATATTLDPGVSDMAVNAFAGGFVSITSGTGQGQKVGIVSNTNNSFTVSPAFTTVPDTTSTFRAYLSDFEGVATGGSAAGTAPLTTGSLVDLNRSTNTAGSAWKENEWVGYYILISAGTGAGQTAKIVGNTTNTLIISDGFRDDSNNTTVATNVVDAAKTNWKVAPDASSRYLILPRFYPVEEGKTTHASATADYIRDETKTNRWRVDLYPYKNRPPGDRDTRVYSAFFQSYAIEILDGPQAGEIRPILTNCITGHDGCAETRVDVMENFSGNIGAGTRYRIIRFANSADVGVPASHATSNQYTQHDFGQVQLCACGSPEPCPAPTPTPLGATNYIEDDCKNWVPGQWVGAQFIMRIAQDDNSGQMAMITANTAKTITFTPPLPTTAKLYDRYFLTPADSKVIPAATARTLTVDNSATATGYPSDIWRDGYVDVFDITNPTGTHQFRKILPREPADGNNIIRINDTATGTLGEDFSLVPAGPNFRYRVFQKPVSQTPFLWFGEVNLRKVYDGTTW